MSQRTLGPWSAEEMLELVLNQLPPEEFAEFVRLTNEANEEFLKCTQVAGRLED